MQLTAAAVTPPAEHAARRPAETADAAAAAAGVRRTKMKSIDDKYYAQASREIAERRTVAWLVAKALSDANGDEKQAVAIYIKHRVEQLRDKERQARKEKAKRSLKSNSVLIILAGIVFVTIAAWLMIYVLSRIF